MILIDLQTDMKPSQWDIVAEHSDAEKAILVSIVDFSSNNMYTPDFFLKLDQHVAYSKAELEKNNRALLLNLPMRSIETTIAALHDSIKRTRSLPTFIKAIKHTIIVSTRFAYKAPILMDENAVTIPEANLRFNVKCNLVGTKPIHSVTFCYKKRLTTFVCED